MTVNNTEAKSAIQSAVKNFSTANLSDQAISLFRTLGYNTDRQNPFEEKTYACFKDSFLDGESRFSEEKAFVREWKSVDLLFQISEEEAKGVKAGRFDNKEINSFIFFAVELTKSDCSRTALAQITREINKIFPMPVMIVFRYGEYLTLSVINRRLHKKDEQKDVLEKVTLIKDISVASPHRAHIEILFDLSFDELRRVHKFTNFVELHDAWRKTLDTSVLNKNFYNDVAVMFTKLIGGERKIGSKKMTEEGVLLLPGNTEDIVRKEFAVRLIGRLLFCWFLKKKTSPANIPLISDKILSEKAVEQASDYGYYHSVFEPLFFEVLNRKKDERPEYLRQNEWDQIPFLNGGLFEPHRYDFYDLNKLNTSVYLNTLKIPDKWCKELLGIFEHYHFTIEENTPVEIEISIDPEMLGRIFENLLAEINPETGETARKSTGSYYTPRQIVEYMTDESLKQYLCSKTGIDEQKISVLLSYQDEEADLTEKEKDKIIDASEQLKILDPACGSGAFPMGILQKMILILQKTDPDSRKWLKKLLANIPDPTAREMMRRKLEGEKDLWNYTRKLGVIRSSIYGADIQPIAAEISKLRFFLSLVVDEKIADSDPQGNRGILPLPNLEFKFVCANTLIGLPKGDVGLFESQDAIEKLKELHTAYFSSYDEEKQGIRNGFYEVQKQMTKRLLEWKEIKDSEMLMLAAWNPFSGDSCGWFDPEWMFGIKDGFDIVIGNPPYGASYSAEHKKYFKANYKSAKTGEITEYGNKIKVKGSLDTFSLFIENGFNILKRLGNLIYIVPISITSSDSMTGLHKLLEDNCETIKISSYSVRPQPIFENAVVNTSIIFFVKTDTKCKQIYSTKMYRKNKDFDIQKLVNNLEFVDVQIVKLQGRYPKIGTHIEKNILQKLFGQKHRVADFLINTGFPIYYRTTGGRYFKVVTPYSTGSTKEKPVFINKTHQNFLGAVLSSNLYFWFYQIYSNNLDLKSYELESFPLPDFNLIKPKIILDIENRYNHYLEDIEKNANIRKTKKYANIDYFKEYKIGKSKQLIDKLDDLICPLYGLMQKETDFIKKYEIEFRISDNGSD